MLAIVAAGIWAVYTFSRKVAEDARQERPVWSPKLTLTKIGERGSEVAIRATLLLENRGTARQNYWAGTLNVFGWRVRAVGDAGVTDPIGVPDASINWKEFRGFKEEDRILIASYGLSVIPPENAFVDPGDSYERNYLIYVDRSQLDFVEAKIRLLVPEDPSVEVGRESWLVQTPSSRGYQLDAADGGKSESFAALNCGGSAGDEIPSTYTTGATVQMSLWDEPGKGRDGGR